MTFYVQTSTSENINVYDYLKRIYGKTIQHSFTNMVVKIFFYIYIVYFFLLPFFEEHTFKVVWDNRQYLCGQKYIIIKILEHV